MSNKTENQLAEAARNLVLQFDFGSRKPRLDSQLKEAQVLYREIFYVKTFAKVKSNSFRFGFDQDAYAKVTTCTKCAKRIYLRLQAFANVVLD